MSPIQLVLHDGGSCASEQNKTSQHSWAIDLQHATEQLIASDLSLPINRAAANIRVPRRIGIFAHMC